MKFSIGDQILLKRTGEEGRVVAFLSSTMMEVEVAGIRFPVYNEEVDHPYLKWFTEKKKPVPKRPAEIPVEKPAGRQQRLARGIYLSFLPQFAPGLMDDVIESFQIHFVNETPDAIAFSYQARAASGESLFRHKASQHAFGHVYLHPLSLEEVNAQPRFHWEVTSVAAPGKEPVSGLLRVRPAQLIRHIREMPEQNNPGFSLLLAQDADSISTQAQTEKELPAPAAPTRTGNETPRVLLHTRPEEVLDLHLDEQEDEGALHSPEHILVAQLNVLERKLQAALVTGMPRMIVIHGIGNGTLREKVHELLRATAGVRSFDNRWMGPYGWGATEVIFDTH